MQYSSIYLLTLVFGILQLQFELYRKKSGWLIYLWLGILTAFFDFLTYPPAAWAICLTIGILMMEGTQKQKMLHALASGAAWCFGYGGMWSGKWIIGTLITGQNILADATQSVQLRTGLQMEGIPESETVSCYADVLMRNLDAYRNVPALILVLALALFAGYLLLRRGYRFRPDTTLVLPLLLIAVVPFAWYFVLKNHSGVHYWMTHRNLSATIIALAGFLSFSLKKPSSVPKNKLSGGPDHG